MAFNTIIFDFDGTVANTNGLVIDSWQHVYQKLSGHKVDEAVIRTTFGEPLPTSMEKAFPNIPVEESIGIYRNHQKDIYEEMIEPFPGMVDLMRQLKEKGYKVGIATSRMKSSTLVGLRKFGVMDYIDALVTCDDTNKHKPDPEPVLISLERLQAKPEEALMIGDSMFDIKCAHNAGVKAVLVGWAEAVTEEDLQGSDAPEYQIEKAEDLFKIL